MNLNNLNNLNMNAKIEELLSTLKKKEDEKEKNTVLWVLGNCWCSCCCSSVLHLRYIAFLHRIIWRTSKKILMMISMTILRMTKKSKCIIIMYDTAPAEIPGLFYCQQPE